MQLNQIRKAFLGYFRQSQHDVLSSSPLIPHNDPSLMFTNAGMVQFKNYFTGIEQPKHQRITTSQKCVRAGGKHNDLENVGYTARHHTFFEMLGNFSFGDYFKEEAIFFAWEFLTKILELSREKLYITIFHDDDEAMGLWKKITGFSEYRIIKIKTSDNFWSMGDVGPCGPCTEVFYDHGEKVEGGLPGTASADGDRYTEIWNLVFMQYEMKQDGKRVALPKPCVDTGMGLERIASVVQGVSSNYDIDLFKKLIARSAELTGASSDSASHKVISDHLRASAFLIADGVMPSNEGRGYVLRRIMRRAMRHIHHLGYKDTVLHKLLPTLINEMGEHFKKLSEAEELISSVLQQEESAFSKTLGKGMKILEDEVAALGASKALSGRAAFKLYDTFGFPLDLTRDILKSRKISVDTSGFEEEMALQKKRAREAWVGSGEQKEDAIWFALYEKLGATEFIGYQFHKSTAAVVAIVQDGKSVENVTDGDAILVLNQTPFYAESGGQVGDKGKIGSSPVYNTQIMAGKVYAHFLKVKAPIAVGDAVDAKIDVGLRKKTAANHSATHLLHYVLRKKFGTYITQKGSLVEPHRFRFDFSHTKGLSSHEIEGIEEEMNFLILQNTSVKSASYTLEEAKGMGAIALFGEKYESQVRVVSMGNSIELCGGTHVLKIGDIGFFKIVKEEAIASGIRRIEAVTGLEAVRYVNSKLGTLKDATDLLKCSESDLLPSLKKMLTDQKEGQKELQRLTIQNLLSNIKIKEIDGVKLAAGIFKEEDAAKHLKNIADTLRERHPKSVIALIAHSGSRVSLAVSVTKDLTDKYQANNLLKPCLQAIDGKGGGNQEFAQAGGGNISGACAAIEIIKKEVNIDFCK